MILAPRLSFITKALESFINKGNSERIENVKFGTPKPEIVKIEICRQNSLVDSCACELILQQWNALKEKYFCKSVYIKFCIYRSIYILDQVD